MATIERDGFVPSNELDLQTIVVGGKEYKVEEAGELSSARQFLPYKPEHFTKPAKEGKPIPLIKGIMSMDMSLELRRSVGLEDVKFYKERWVPATIGGKKVTVKTFGSDEYRQLYIHYQAVFDCWIMEDGKVKNYKLGYYIDPTKPIQEQSDIRVKLICQALEKYGEKYLALVFSMTAKMPKRGSYPYAMIRFERYDDAKGIVGVPDALFKQLPSSGQAPITMKDVGIFKTSTIDRPEQDDGEGFLEE